MVFSVSTTQEEGYLMSSDFESVPLVPEQGIKISQIAKGVFLTLALLSTAAVIASGVLLFHVGLASAFIGFVISCVAFGVLGTALMYPCIEEYMPSFVQELADLVVGIVKEIFAVPLVLSSKVINGIFGKDEEPFDQEGDPVLLSSGYMGTSGNLLYLKYHLKKNETGAVFTMDYEDLFASIDDFAEAMRVKVEEIQQHYPGKKVTIIGHSMGGIIASRYAANCEDTTHIEKIITLGSPLQGTCLASLAPGKCGREMESKSDYLEKLDQDLSTKNVSFINVGSRSDLVVLSDRSSVFKTVASKKIVFGDMGHATYLCSDKVAAFLIHELKKQV